MRAGTYPVEGGVNPGVPEYFSAIFAAGVLKGPTFSLAERGVAAAWAMTFVAGAGAVFSAPSSNLTASGSALTAEWAGSALQTTSNSAT